MKRSISIIIFVIVAVAVIALGMWYSGKISENSQNAVAEQGAQAEKQQNQIMQNFKIEDVTIGTGAEAKSGDAVTVNYTGTFDDGKKFDSSYDHGQPFTFTLGASQVIKGWDLGVLGMKVGGKRNLTVPPELGYGPQGYPPIIPPNATLHFVVELVSVSSTAAAQ